MTKKDNIDTYINEIYSSLPGKKYPTNKIIYIHIDEIWSFELADMIEHKTSQSKGFRYIFVNINIFSNYIWCIPLKNKNAKTITNKFSNILTESKRKSVKIKPDREADFCKCIFQNFLKFKKIYHLSWFTDNGPSTADRLIRTIRYLLKKPAFLKGNADSITDLLSAIKKNINTIYHSIRLNTTETSLVKDEKKVFNNFRVKRKKQSQSKN